GACRCDNLPLPLPLSLTPFRLSPDPLRLRFRGSGRSFWMGDRVVDCSRLESVCAERHRGFESPPIRPASAESQARDQTHNETLKTNAIGMILPVAVLAHYLPGPALE